MFIALFFIFIYFLIDFLEKSTRYFPKYHVPLGTIFKYYGAQLPKIFTDILPFSILFGSSYTFFQMTRKAETSALLAFGLSPYKIFSPVFLGGILFVLIHGITSEFFVPQSQQYFKKLETYEIENNPLEKMFFETHWIRGSQGILHFKEFDPLSGNLKSVEYYTFSLLSKTLNVSYGEEASFEKASESWVLNKVTRYSFDPVYKVDNLDTLVTSVKYEPIKVLKDHVSSDQVSFRDLYQFINSAEKRGSRFYQREVDLYQKITTPFLNLFYCFFSFPLIFPQEREKSKYLYFVFCLLVVILYNVFLLITKNLAYLGYISPFISCFAPFGILCFICFSRLELFLFPLRRLKVSDTNT